MHPTDDTIAAMSSAVGSGRRAIVRLSGPHALEHAGSLLSEINLDAMPGFCAADALLSLPATDRRLPVDLPARVYLFRAPRSYTRQDLVELHVPGNAALASAVLSSLLDLGCRRAGPGEFTFRAFCFGRIDLAEAEAVADLIASADDATHRRALAGLDGELHRRTAPAADALADVLATVEASIDLAEEDLHLARPGQWAETLHDRADRLADLARNSARLGEDNGLPAVALAGRPNAGKSTLLNALAGWERAIISAQAGTTRDVLSAEIALPGGAAELLDAAGLIGDDADPLDRAARQAARAVLARAEAVLFLRGADAPDEANDARLLDEIHHSNPRAPRLILETKSDLAPDRSSGPCGPPADLAVSAKTGQGLDDLRRRLSELLDLHVDRPGESLGLHDRQRRCLLAAADAARRAANLLDPAETVADVAELAAVELRDALRQLAQITGEVVNEDILGRIFARFCVGK
jgi:tRNA modification GTPase